MKRKSEKIGAITNGGLMSLSLKTAWVAADGKFQAPRTHFPLWVWRALAAVTMEMSVRQQLHFGSVINHPRGQKSFCFLFLFLFCQLFPFRRWPPRTPRTTGFFFFSARRGGLKDTGAVSEPACSFSCQELHHHRVHRGPTTQQPEPTTLPPPHLQPGGQRGHEDRSHSAQPAGDSSTLSSHHHLNLSLLKKISIQKV